MSNMIDFESPESRRRLKTNKAQANLACKSPYHSEGEEQSSDSDDCTIVKDNSPGKRSNFTNTSVVVLDADFEQASMASLTSSN